MDAELLFYQSNGEEDGMLFTCLYLCSLLIEEFPPIRGLIEHLHKVGISSLSLKNRPGQDLRGRIEIDLLISVVVESLESGMWRGNPRLRRSFRPMYGLSFASLVQNQSLSIDRRAQEEIRNRLIEVYDFCRGGDGASAKRYPDSAYLRGTSVRKTNQCRKIHLGRPSRSDLMQRQSLTKRK